MFYFREIKSLKVTIHKRKEKQTKEQRMVLTSNRPQNHLHQQTLSTPF